MIWRYMGRASVWEMFMPLYILCIHSIYSAHGRREGPFRKKTNYPAGEAG
jgi:hypothetical protein